MLQQPHQGYDFIKGSPISLLIFNQYQSYLKDVKIVIKEDNIILHYPSDDIVLLDKVPESILKQVKEEKRMFIWEVNPYTGKLTEQYSAVI